MVGGAILASQLEQEQWNLFIGGGFLGQQAAKSRE